MYFLGLSPYYCGTLPFAFLSWFAYSIYLVAKIAVIFTSEIPAFMTNLSSCKKIGPKMFKVHKLLFINFSANLFDDPINNLGSNLLKVTIGLAALVFIIMLQVTSLNL